MSSGRIRAFFPFTDLNFVDFQGENYCLMWKCKFRHQPETFVKGKKCVMVICVEKTKTSFFTNDAFFLQISLWNILLLCEGFALKRNLKHQIAYWECTYSCACPQKSHHRDPLSRKKCVSCCYYDDLLIKYTVISRIIRVLIRDFHFRCRD